MENHTIKKIPFEGSLKKAVNDDLIYNVPIYDMGRRRFAAFCSFTEAVWHEENDYKGNGEFLKNDIKEPLDWFMVLMALVIFGLLIQF